MMNPQTDINGIMQSVIAKNMNQLDPLRNNSPYKKKQEKFLRLKEREYIILKRALLGKKDLQ